MMFRPEPIEPRAPFASNCEGVGRSHPVTGLDASRLHVLAGVLSRALHDEPRLVHMIPDGHTREVVLPWLVASAIRAGEVYGETFVTPSANGGAIWIRPGGGPGFHHMFRSELRRLPFKLSKASVKRWLKISACLEGIRQRLAVKSHWYLLALGMEPPGLTNTTAAAVIAPVLRHADFEGVD